MRPASGVCPPFGHTVECSDAGLHCPMERILAGRYRLISQLGIGGMGITYRAWDSEQGIPCVVKMPRPEQRDAAAIQRFAREIEAMVALRHEHIVPVTDHGSDHGLPFVVMRFLPGGSLADQRRINKDGTAMPTPPGFLRFWLPDIAAALDFIHRQGVIHRDVKPRNIFFDGFWKAFLGDFGIAKVLEESERLSREQTLTAADVAVGTQEYMAPELFMKKEGHSETGQIDQYALAITTYEMLAGKRPFTGATAHIAVEHLQMVPPTLRRAGLGLPASLCAAIERALDKVPEKRFVTCADFAAAALADVPTLEAETGVARLLCPKCTMVLRIPVKSAGRSGTCPTCKSVMRIAPDFGALWLGTEDVQDRTASPAGDPPPTFMYEEDVTTSAVPARISLAEGIRRRWRDLVDTARFDWPRASVTIVPALAAAASLYVTHEVWSIYHQGVVDRMEAERAVQTVAMEKKLAQGTREATALRQENASLRDDVGDMEQVLANGSFERLKSITPSFARCLARRKKGDLSLDGLTSLSEESAAALARHEGSLSLNGLGRLSDDAARELAKHRGPVLLQGLLTASPDAIQSLKSNDSIKLPTALR